MLFYDYNDLKKSLTVFTFIQSNSNNKNKLTFLTKYFTEVYGFVLSPQKT